MPKPSAPVATIDVRIARIESLFESLDPSPFHEKDLDDDAAEYIVSTARDFPLKAPLRLEIYLPPDQIRQDTEESVTNAVHNFFDYKTEVVDSDLRTVLRQGRVSLLIGLTFLSACLFARQLLGTQLPQGTVREILAEGLLISGWVAMWRPIQIFLYEWWPIRNLRRLYHKLSHLKIDVRARD